MAVSIVESLNTSPHFDSGWFVVIIVAFFLYLAMIVINSHQTQTENDEFKGLGSLILGLHQMVRNPDAHTVRIKKETELNECLYFNNCFFGS